MLFLHIYMRIKPHTHTFYKVYIHILHQILYAYIIHQIFTYFYITFASLSDVIYICIVVSFIYFIYNYVTLFYSFLYACVYDACMRQ